GFPPVTTLHPHARQGAFRPVQAKSGPFGYPPLVGRAEIVSWTSGGVPGAVPAHSLRFRASMPHAGQERPISNANGNGDGKGNGNGKGKGGGKGNGRGSGGGKKIRGS